MYNNISTHWNRYNIDNKKQLNKKKVSQRYFVLVVKKIKKQVNDTLIRLKDV